MVLDEPAVLQDGTAVSAGMAYHLADGEMHPVYSTAEKSPLHHAEAGKRGFLLLALEFYGIIL
jgi:hypothetical protein